jgi:hypothetical protein
MKKLVVAAVWIAITAGLAAGAHPATAAASDPAWVTGLALTRQLAAPVGVVWAKVPLATATGGLSRAEHVAAILDRRVDPDQRVDLTLSSVPLGTALEKIAASRQLGVTFLGPVAYFAPPEAAARLRTIAAARAKEIRRLPPAIARRLLRSGPLAWADFSAPQDLLTELGRQGGVEIAGLERVPHDLWAAADLPPLSWSDRVTLIVHQFDLTFEVARDGSSIHLVPLPQATAEEKRVRPLPRAVGQPAAEVRLSRLAVHEKPLGPVLEQLAQRLQFELCIDRSALEAAGISLDQRVSVEVEGTTLDEALAQLLRKTPLTFRHRGNVVEVYERAEGRRQ